MSQSYTAAIKTLFRSNLENSYLLYHLDKENILMKSHYCELNGSEKEERFLNSHIRHFKKFLKNDCKNIQKNIIALHNNSIKLVEYLIKLKNKNVPLPSNKELEKKRKLIKIIQKKIQELNPPIFRTWFSEQLQELI